jgi:hypothetical protein
VSYFFWLLNWWIVHGMDVFYVMVCAVPVVLLIGAGVRYWLEPERGVTIHGVHYQDVWRDD